MYLPLVWSSSLISLAAMWMFLGVLANIIAVFSALIFSFILFVNVTSYKVYTFVFLGPWLDYLLEYGIELEWSFVVDAPAAIMLVVITFISFLVQCYSIGYMSTDFTLVRFLSYLNVFTFFMVFFVTSSNLFLLFMAWEGIGFSSFLLINYWFPRAEALRSAVKAILTNKVGDVFFFLAVVLAYSFFSTGNWFDFLDFVLELNFFSVESFGFSVFNALSFFGLFIFGAAIAKSAQLGLHTWLPDAMEGPTPVSALIHAATMVTVGVFLLVRFSFIFSINEMFCYILGIIGGVTAFMAATIGAVQNDIKKVIAYSTCSQLGYMFMACAFGGFEVGLYHLFNHAFFKALLFLNAGVLIHSLQGEQDMRRMGGLVILLPFSYVITLIGSFSLAGVPFMTGFYSKDSLLGLLYSHYSSLSFFVYILALVTVFLTSFYSMRSLYLVFYNEFNGARVTLLSVHESTSPFLIAPLIVLAFASIFFGYLFRDMFVGVGSVFFNAVNLNVLDMFSYDDYLVAVEFLPVTVKLLPIFVVLCGFLCSLIFFEFGSRSAFYSLSFVRVVFRFFSRRWFIDYLYNYFLFQVNGLNIFYKAVFKFFERGIIEAILAGWGLLARSLYLLFNDMRYFKSSYLSVELFFSLFFLTFPAILIFLSFEQELNLSYWFFIQVYSVGEYFYHYICVDFYETIWYFLYVFATSKWGALIFFYFTGLFTNTFDALVLGYLPWVCLEWGLWGYGPDYLFFQGAALRFETGYNFLLGYDSIAVFYITHMFFILVLFKYAFGLGYKLALIGGVFLLAFAFSFAELAILVLVFHGLASYHALLSELVPKFVVMHEELEDWL